jgi:very-short-patch-repair endonuclease
MSGNANISPPPLRGRSDRVAVREGGPQPAHHRPIPWRAQARALRHNMTEAERRLWYWLRAHRFSGVAFRRQSPIGSYIVDFVSHTHRLVIEIDGGQHSENTSDVRRDDWLSSKGYRVLRFWNSEVLRDRDRVLARIAEAVSNSAAPSRRPRTAFASGDLPHQACTRARASATRVGGGEVTILRG